MSPGLNWVVVKTKGDYAAYLSATASLFETTFGREFPRAIWNQYYFENPYGDPIVSLAYSGSTLIAHQGLIPGVTSDGNTDIPYHLVLSTMVHPAHRATLAFIELFESGHRQASIQGSAFTLGFPNAKVHPLIGPLFGYRTIVESPLRNWVPPGVEHPTISADPALGRSSAGQFSPPSSDQYWSWRTTLNGARAVVLNAGLRIVYKLLPGGTLNVLNMEMPGCGATRADLAGLAAAEGCGNVRMTEYHASMLGIAASELTSHEDYCVRMSALKLCQPVPDLQFNLLFCDVF
jgi:hypothetical protein